MLIYNIIYIYTYFGHFHYDVTSCVPPEVLVPKKQNDGAIGQRDMRCSPTGFEIVHPDLHFL